MGTINSTFEIDQMAQRVFINSFPAKWLIREQSPDVHIDYFVEIVETTEPTGLVFGAQLKGTGSPKYSGKYLKYSFKVKHLAYYLDKVKQPIFLVVVDIKTSTGYWILAQYIAKNEMRPNWRHKTNIEIKIPLANRLDNTDLLSNEVKRADLFMRELWPGSVAAAIKHEEHKLAELDDRFNINIKFDKGITCYELHAKENISGEISIKSNNDAVAKMNDLIMRGKPVHFEPGELSIAGSKLFDNLTEKFSSHGVQVEASKTIKCDVVISILNQENTEIHSIHGLYANMKGGHEQVSVEIDLPNSPLSIKFKKGLRLAEKPEKEDITISLNLDNWSGQRLMFLSYFDQLSRFFKLINVGNKIKLTFIHQGNQLFQGISTVTEEAYFIKEILPYIETLEDARAISRKFDIYPIVPKFENITQDDAESLAIIREIVEKGEHRQKNEGVRASVSIVAGDGMESLVKEGKFPGDSVTINQFRGCAYVFGTEVETLSLSHQLTKVRFTDETRQKLAQVRQGDEIELVWEGLEGSEYITTQLLKDDN